MSKKFIIGIDLGGTNLKIALLDLRYKIKNKNILSTKNFIVQESIKHFPIPLRKSPKVIAEGDFLVRKEKLIQGILDSVKRIIQDSKLNKSNILGVGVGLPGPIDVAGGIVHFFPNIPGWKEVNLKNILEAKLKLPVYLDNDANLMALAEVRLGAARKYKNIVCLTLGTGVGGGIIIGANLYRGLSFASGEIGHMPINEKGPRCNCGGYACLEAYIGNKRILKRARDVFKRNISLEELSSLAKKGNRKAGAIWSEVGNHLGVALTGVVNLLNPDAIVIGGGIAGAGRLLFNKVKEIILKRAMSIQARHVKILKAKLGSDAGTIGAAILVKES